MLGKLLHYGFYEIGFMKLAPAIVHDFGITKTFNASLITVTLRKIKNQ